MSNEALTDLDKLLTEAIAHHRRGELTKAEWGYQAVLERDPKQPDAHHLLGVVAHQMGSASAAIEHVKTSLSLNPDQPSALNNLGNMLVDDGQLDEAIECYQRAIELNPDYAQAHHNLGNVLADCDRVDESMASYRRVLELCPDDVESLLALGGVRERFGQFAEAVEEYRKAMTVDSDSTIVCNRLGRVLRKMNRLEEACTVYERWIELAPDDPVAGHLLSACKSDAPPDRASTGYIRSSFDSFADEFDDRLSELKYQVPDLFGELLQRRFGQSVTDQWDVADLGCGTGLCAPHLRGLASRVVGVDLSAGMLAKARERGLYDELVEMELTEFLQGCDAQFDLLVAADTLIYIGDLQSTFASAAAALRPGGHLLFSIEKMNGTNSVGQYHLQPSGRYSHDVACVRRWLEEAGFEVDELVEAVVREEGGDQVIGQLIMSHKR